MSSPYAPLSSSAVLVVTGVCSGIYVMLSIYLLIAQCIVVFTRNVAEPVEEFPICGLLVLL